jgi:hypothetical protein
MMLRLLRPELLNGNEMLVTGMMPIVIQTFTNATRYLALLGADVACRLSKVHSFQKLGQRLVPQALPIAYRLGILG